MKKYSRYNTIVPVSDKFDAIYNAVSDMTVFVKRTPGCFNKIPNKGTPLYETFVKAGVLVNADKNERDAYIDLARKIETDNDCFHLLLNPTLNCNFNCWYCYEQHSKTLMGESTLQSVKNFIERTIVSVKEFTMSFFGGEPLLGYNAVILPLMSHLQALSKDTDTKTHINMTSNGYLLNEKRIVKLKKLGLDGMQITLDGNEPKHNKIRHIGETGTYRRILSNIFLLANYHIPVTVRINSSNLNINSLHYIIADFANLPKDTRKYINFDFHVVWQEENQNSLKSQIREIASSFVRHGFKASIASFRDYCYGDLRNSVLINYNGDLYKCTAVDFENTLRDGYIDSSGRLIWENDSLENRMKSKFTNDRCVECPIFPLCHGGCTKQSMKSKDYCLHNGDELKRQAVIDRIEYLISLKSSKT